MTVLHSTWPALQNHLCGQACMPRIDSYQSLPVKQPNRGGYCYQGKHHHRNVPRGFRRLRTVQIAASRSVSNTQAVIQSNDGKHAREMCKSKVQQELLGVNRGIFGTKAAKFETINKLLIELEQSAEEQSPARDLTRLSGSWKLLYTSLTIKGARKTKLGLREFVTLGKFEQVIDITSNKAINRVGFSVTGLGNLSGSLTITASFQAVSAKRVQITYESALLVPKALERLFASNYDMLLSIFNPEGWLDITYVDDTHRVGRDDKGNVFYLERS